MKISLLSSFSLSLITNIFLFLIPAVSPQVVEDGYLECNKTCNCGSSMNIKYPFWGCDRPSYCGLQGYELECPKDPVKPPIFDMSLQRFVVNKINGSSSTMTIAREDWLENNCYSYFVKTDMNFTLVDYGQRTKNLTLFGSCTSEVFGTVDQRKKLTCEDNDGYIVPLNYSVLFDVRCKNNLTFPVLQENMEGFEKNTLSLLELMKNGFEVNYERQANMTTCHNCEKSGGICGTNTATYDFTCFCKDGPHSFSCPGSVSSLPELQAVAGVRRPDFNDDDRQSSELGDQIPLVDQLKERKKSHVGRTIGIVFGAFGGVLLIAGLIFIILRYRKKKGKGKLVASSWESRDILSYSSSVLDLENSSSYYGVQVFDYNDLQEATNNFDENKELGDGGFGVVYQGKLRDGRVVAVKRLYERNFKRVEQFKNEVEILAKLRHKNLVTLYGCTSRNSRELLLVYEYVSNGTIADHLHGERAKPGSLSWTTRMSIAVETADALLFLHKSDVIHRDVKTNNILLDDNFSVKVADFGLSRLYPNNVTHVSTAPQGTPGYVDPEYHQCYRLTNKSDVYSFGVVLIELITSMPAVDITRHRHDINLSNMAIDKIQNCALSEIVDPYLGFDTDFKVRKMINGVAELAFQCLQNGKDMRPSMAEVLEILKTISSEEYSVDVIEEMEIAGGDGEYLKSEPPAVSPGSKSSNNTTPNTSS